MLALKREVTLAVAEQDPEVVAIVTLLRTVATASRLPSLLTSARVTLRISYPLASDDERWCLAERSVAVAEINAIAVGVTAIAHEDVGNAVVVYIADLHESYLPSDASGPSELAVCLNVPVAFSHVHIHAPWFSRRHRDEAHWPLLLKSANA